MLALQRGHAWAEERLLGALRQSVPQNGCVLLHIAEQPLSETLALSSGVFHQDLCASAKVSLCKWEVHRVNTL